MPRVGVVSVLRFLFTKGPRGYRLKLSIIDTRFSYPIVFPAGHECVLLAREIIQRLSQ